MEQVVEGVRVLHSHGHQGEIPRDQALAAAASQAQPLAAHGTTEGKQRDPETGLFKAAQEAEPLAAHGGAAIEQAMESRPDNVRSGDWGNGQSYLLRRLARDAPDILERVKSG